jgi:hypothetical protein
MFVLVPFGALLVQLVTRKTRRNYPHHLYFALHVHAAYFAVLAATTLFDLLRLEPLSNVLSIFRVLFLAGYLLIAFHAAYGGGWRLAAGRSLFVIAAYSIALTIALVLVLFGVLLSIRIIH